MPKAAQPASDTEPDRLVRQPDGGYTTPDGRFAVEQANGSWFLADQETADDFGQPRVAGPFATLKLVREAIPRARSGPVPLRKPIRQARARKAPPAPKPETWLDRLSAEDRRRAERMIRALEKEGLADAEELARARVEGGTARGLAKRLLRARLERALAEADGPTREQVVATLAVLTDAGRIGSDLPGWALVETEPDGSPTDRRIELD